MNRQSGDKSSTSPIFFKTLEETSRINEEFNNEPIEVEKINRKYKLFLLHRLLVRSLIVSQFYVLVPLNYHHK